MSISGIEFLATGTAGRNADIKAALLIAATMLVGAWMGAYLANQMEGPHLRLVFGLLLFLTGLGIYLVYGASKRLDWL